MLTCVSGAERPQQAYDSSLCSAQERVFRGINLILSKAGVNQSSKITYLPNSLGTAATMNSEYTIDVVNLYKSLFSGVSEMNDKGSQSLKDGLWIQTGAEAGDGITIKIDEMNPKVLGINTIDISSQAGASDAIDALKGATEKVNGIRSTIGSLQNRLEHTYKNVTNTAENSQAAESRIRDTDMAKEMVELSKQNILEQVGTAVMAQANQMNQEVLALVQ